MERGRDIRLDRPRNLAIVLGAAAVFDLALMGHLALSVGLLEVSILLTLVDLVRRRPRSRYALRLLLLVVALGPAFLGMDLGRSYGRWRAGPVIDAVERYHVQTGSYPVTLSDLVPDYLGGIPRPTLRLFGSTEFRYRSGRPVSPELPLTRSSPQLEWTWTWPFGRCGYDFGRKSFTCLD